MVIRKTFYKGIILFLVIFGLTAGSASANAPKAIQTRVKNISTSILHKDWDKAYKQTGELRNYFDKNRWKYQLLGDEKEYEGISNDIENLKAAIIAKDKSLALIITSDIKEIFNQIFQL